MKSQFIFLALLILMLSACGNKPILEQVSVSPQLITPNADHETDLSKIEFLLNQTSYVSITLQDEDKNIYTFRPPKRLSLNEKPYVVYFGGVVEGYTKADEADPDYTILKRMLPNGTYTWQILAETETGERAVGERAAVTGTLIIQNADTVLPGIRGFSVSPKTFSPNQDGIDDRVQINLYLEKDVKESLVYLKGHDNVRHYIPENEEQVEPNQHGLHAYNWDGGIDVGNEPPEDGTYTIYAEARDAMGQWVIVSETLEIINAGLPRAYILNAEVEYSANTRMVLSDTLCYTLTVENDSNTYLRTVGPWPGTTYRSNQNFNAFNRAEESGVFRVGMDFDTSLRNYPFRWGIGQPGVDLVQIDDYWYLPPWARSTVTGCVQVVEMPVRNPLYYWTGLIHEDVEIASVNNRVDPVFLRIYEP